MGNVITLDLTIDRYAANLGLLSNLYDCQVVALEEFCRHCVSLEGFRGIPMVSEPRISAMIQITRSHNSLKSLRFHFKIGGGGGI